MKKEAQGLSVIVAPEVTAILVAWNRGDPDALGELIPLVMEELRRMAGRQLALERPGHTLQPTAVINEIYLRWSQQQDFGWQNRAHFFAIAAVQIRHILVEHARKKRAEKRGRGQAPIRLTDLDDLAGGTAGRTVDLIDLDRALEQLHEMDPRYSKLVELRFFGGLSAREAAEALGVTERTVLRHWAWIKAWLFQKLDSKNQRATDDEPRRLETSQGSLRGGARETDR